MDGIGDDVLACAGFTKLQHRAVEGSYLLNHFHDIFQAEIFLQDPISCHALNGDSTWPRFSFNLVVGKFCVSNICAEPSIYMYLQCLIYL